MAVRNARISVGGAPVQITNGITGSTLVTIVNLGPGIVYIAPSVNTTPPASNDTVAWIPVTGTPAGMINRTAAELWPGFAGVTEIFAYSDGGIGRLVTVSHA